MPVDSENKWNDFCNFSKMRQGIISWYDFKDYSDVLEIGANYGVKYYVINVIVLHLLKKIKIR